MDASELRSAWIDLWDRIGVAGDPEPVYEDLKLRLSEPARAYHTLDHIAHCLTELTQVQDKLTDPPAVELALWFHDAVYDTRRHDNEERSAALARQFALRASLSEPFLELVSSLILVTKHTRPPTSIDERHIVDIDLSILGKSRSRFDEYEQQIRKEYDWVPADAFAKGRAAILSGFLARPSIFSTEFFQRKYESAARENLTRSLMRLSPP
jgi:predicted metal-dependent HD superfamily phosphohydrolase